jgi:hypothetical protein
LLTHRRSQLLLRYQQTFAPAECEETKQTAEINETSAKNAECEETRQTAEANETSAKKGELDTEKQRQPTIRRNAKPLAPVHLGSPPLWPHQRPPVPTTPTGSRGMPKTRSE